MERRSRLGAFWLDMDWRSRRGGHGLVKPVASRRVLALPVVAVGATCGLFWPGGVRHATACRGGLGTARCGWALQRASLLGTAVMAGRSWCVQSWRGRARPVTSRRSRRVRSRRGAFLAWRSRLVMSLAKHGGAGRSWLDQSWRGAAGHVLARLVLAVLASQGALGLGEVWPGLDWPGKAVMASQGRPRPGLARQGTSRRSRRGLARRVSVRPGASRFGGQGWVRSVQAGPGGAWFGPARQGRGVVRFGAPSQGSAVMATPVSARHGSARPGGPGETRPGLARLGWARRSWLGLAVQAWPVQARLGASRQAALWPATAWRGAIPAMCPLIRKE
jgi:hypothetical protein